jgi:hypothetical protein
MKCTKCSRSADFQPPVQATGGPFVGAVAFRSHADAERWAYHCKKCEASFCGQCCLPEWQALKAKEGLSGRELAAKLEKDPRAFFAEMPKCPQCGGSVRSEAPLGSAAGGCFVATLVYGDAAAPEVVILRCWRDSVLVRSVPGRAAISAYGACGPVAARLLTGRATALRIVRLVLDAFVRHIAS